MRHTDNSSLIFKLILFMVSDAFITAGPPFKLTCHIFMIKCLTFHRTPDSRVRVMAAVPDTMRTTADGAFITSMPAKNIAAVTAYMPIAFHTSIPSRILFASIILLIIFFLCFSYYFNSKNAYIEKNICSPVKIICFKNGRIWLKHAVMR